MKTFAALLSLLALGLVAARAQVSPKQAAQVDQRRLEGTWVVTDLKGFDKEKVREEIKELRLTFEGNQLVARYDGKMARATFRLQAAKKPTAIDVKVTDGPKEVEGKVFHGIYLLEGDTLKIAYRRPGEKRPTAFNLPDAAPPVYEVYLKKVKE